MTRRHANAIRLLGLSLGFATGMLALLRWGPGAGDRGGGPALRAPGAGTQVLEWKPAERPWDPSLGSRPRFADVTGAAGIAFRHTNGRTGRYHYPEIMGAGVGLFDYDGDGRLDIYFVNGNRLIGEPSADITNRLYRNEGDGTFADVTERAGAGDAGFGQGCCVGDYDDDGDPDLYVSNYGRNVLYRNNGDGTFTDATEAAGVEDPLWGQSSSFLDYDGDGWLDLYVQNYLTYSLDTPFEAYILIGDEKFPDYPSPGGFRGSPDHLYRNEGDGTFRDATSQAGLLRRDGKGMGCACLDMDDDGDIDLLVTNDGMENYLFRNRGDGRFDEVGLAAGVAFDGGGIPEGSMGVDVGDFDGDGRLDLVNPCLRRQVFTLYRNRGAYFEDASLAAGLAQATADRTGFNANVLDFDGDGDLDLFFTTGGVRANERVPADASYDERYGAEDLLLANDGSGAFRNVSAWAGAHFRRRLIGRGSATGDLDEDGDIDLVISNLAGPAVVLRNDTRAGHWITLKLVGRTGNRDALGADVRVRAGGRLQRFAVHGAVTYLSQSDRRVHIGLGAASRIDRLEIVWPGGKREVLEDLPADRSLLIVEGKAPAG